MGHLLYRCTSIFAPHIDACQYTAMAKLKILSGCCPGVLQTRLKAADAEHLAAAFKVLSDPARVRLLSLIAAQADGEACVCNLIAPLGLGQPTVSHHLKVMHEAGLLERERRGTWVYYRVVPEALTRLRDALAVPETPKRAHAAAK